MEWKPLLEPGVKTDGIFVKVLRHEEATGRAPTFLLPFAPGASYPDNNQPRGEEVPVLEGGARFGADPLSAGDYLCTTPGAKNPVYSRDGCFMFSMAPEEVQITGNRRDHGPAVCEI